MAASPQKGSPVALIVFIVLFVFATMGLVFVSIELNKARKMIDEGWESKKNLPMAQDIDRHPPGLKLALFKAREQLRLSEESLDKYMKLVGTMNPADIRKELDAIEPELREIQQGQSLTLMGYLKVLQDRLDQARQQREDELRAAEDQRKELAKRLGGALANVQEREETLTKLKGQLQAIEARYAGNLSTLRDEANKVRNQLRTERARFETAQNTSQEQIARLERFINDLQRRLKESSTIKVEGTGWTAADESPDGEVILVDRNAGVIINIGRKKGVRRGLRFHVYALKADGTRVKRGEVEVKTVYPEISRCKLLGDVGDPTEVIHQKDVVVNVAFDPGRARVFVADTVFDATKKQGLREALARHGSVLEEDVTVRTNYLIVGSTPGKHYPVAEKLGVPLIRENDLNEFLGR
jgi:NAD-dependent DNA ligase